MQQNEALDWIVSFLEAQNISYLVCGGLAAIAYGAKRPLNDIDIYVPESEYHEVVNFGSEFITYGPKRFKNECWDVDYVQFLYKGQRIEVGSSNNIRIFDSDKKVWFSKKLSFERYRKVTVFGKTIRVMEKESLVDYKRKLNREVDRIDLGYISNT